MPKKFKNFLIVPLSLIKPGIYFRYEENWWQKSITNKAIFCFNDAITDRYRIKWIENIDVNDKVAVLKG